MGRIDGGILIMPVDDQGSALHGDMCSMGLSSCGSRVAVVLAMGWAGLGWVRQGASLQGGGGALTRLEALSHKQCAPAACKVRLGGWVGGLCLSPAVGLDACCSGSKVAWCVSVGE